MVEDGWTGEGYEVGQGQVQGRKEAEGQGCGRGVRMARGIGKGMVEKVWHASGACVPA